MTTALRVVTDDDLHFDVSNYHALRALAEMYNDIQKTRIGIGNRLGRGEGFGGIFREHVDGLEKMEHHWQLDLVRQYRKTAPRGVIAWQKTQRGIGEPLLARLLGHLGHPRIALPQRWEGTGANRNLVEDEPYERTKAQLRSYCGHGDPKRKKFAGMSAEDAFRLGNPRCKMLVHLLAEACMKQPGTPVSVLLDSDHSGCVSQGASVGVEEPSATNDQRPLGLQAVDVVGGISVAVIDRFSSVNGDQGRSQPHESRVAVDGPSPTSTDQGALDIHAGCVCADGTPRYRLEYEQRRLATVGRLHDGPCVRCGPSGHPAGDGSPWSAQHQQADALRIVGNAILNDLWDAAEL